MRRLWAPVALVAVVLVAAGIVAAAPDPTVKVETELVAEVAPAFAADFATADDFYGRFDYGYSGLNPLADPNGVRSFHGDHDTSCAGPDTDRTVAFAGSSTRLDASQLFWWCAPGGDAAKGHLMTGVDTLSYNIAWFSPKPAFTGITKVCWDQNLTQMSKRKWTQVVFVTGADQTRYPAGARTGVDSEARGSGGFDLGYTSPEFRFPNGDGPTSRVEPIDAGFAGLKIQDNGKASWFNRDTFTAQFVGSEVVTADKASRYRHCLEQTAPGQVTFTQARPGGGQQVVTLPGTIPQGATRVVFQDDNYDPVKGDGYQADVLTWHWDNVQVFTAAGPVPTSSTTPSSTAPATTTTAAPTTTTTAPPATTTSSTSTTSTTAPSTTTSSAPPVPECYTVEDDRLVITYCLKG